MTSRDWYNTWTKTKVEIETRHSQFIKHEINNKEYLFLFGAEEDRRI